MKIKLSLDKPCKHSNRYKSTDKDSPVQTLYVNKPYSENKTHLVIELTEGIEEDKHNV